ncbi:MAG: hypothetical protein ABIP93_08265 [Gemmatimonadaceae bacterium]
MKAVDGAVGALEEEAQACGVVRPDVSAMLAAPIPLTNRELVTPGQITAMMGDMYGDFPRTAGGFGDFNPQGAFDRLTSAPASETRALVSSINREASGTKIPASGWEDLTKGRPSGDLGYLDLATRNNSHFSGPSMVGTDNNMGTYDEFHSMALAAARAGELDRARALESSAMHYLTDRHAAGHSFEKRGVMNVARDNTLFGGFDLIQNAVVKSVHDSYNDEGVQVHDANGNSWPAFGDGSWEVEGNRENRARTARSVTASWGELADINACEMPNSSAAPTAFAAHGTVPQFDSALQVDAEERARDETLGGAAWHSGASALDVGTYKAGRWANENLVDPVLNLKDSVLGSGAWLDREIRKLYGATF